MLHPSLREGFTVLWCRGASACWFVASLCHYFIFHRHYFIVSLSFIASFFVSTIVLRKVETGPAQGSRGGVVPGLAAPAPPKEMPSDQLKETSAHIGSRVRVLWDGEWYWGLVKDYRSDTNEHLLAYTDGKDRVALSITWFPFPS